MFICDYAFINDLNLLLTQVAQRIGVQVWESMFMQKVQECYPYININFINSV